MAVIIVPKSHGKLCHAVVDDFTVYNDDRLVYSLKDGTEITIEL